MYRTAKLSPLRPMVVPFDFAQGRLTGKPRRVGVKSGHRQGSFFKIVTGESRKVGIESGHRQDL